MAKSKIFSILIIIALGLLTYSNTFFSSFHFDDEAYVINNFAIRNLNHLSAIWNICPCRFITFWSLALNYHFYQLNVLSYHIVNILIHISTALLVWCFVLLTFSTPAMKNDRLASHAPAIALFVALIFVSHPVQTEAVTYIWQRAASMTALFYMASLCSYIKSRLDPKKEDIFHFLSLLTAVAAMFTKENAITLPLMIVFYEMVFFKTKKENLDWAQLYLFWVTLFIIPLTMSLTRTTRVGEIASIIGGPGGISPGDYLWTQFRVMLTYIRLSFLPAHLNLDYDYPIFKNFFQLPVLFSFLSIAAIIYWAKYLFSSLRLLSFSIAWFFVTLLPESSILPQTDVIFEHRLYLPLVGFSIFLVSGIFYLFSEKHLKQVIIVLMVLLSCYSILTYQRNKVWKDEITLWKDVVQKSPHKARPYINLGWAYYNQGDFKKAIADYDKAIELDPHLIYPYDDKGLIDAQEGNLSGAITEYNQSININPYYAKVYAHRGLAFLAQRKYSQATADFNKAIELNGQYVDAYNDRASVEMQRGNGKQALADYGKSLDIDPEQPDVVKQLQSLKPQL